MPLPRSLSYFNRAISNRLTRPLARHLPNFGVVEYRERNPGRRYETPVNVFRRPGGFVVALTYGPHVDWVRNVLAEGGCVLKTRGQSLRLVRPRLGHDEARRGVPQILRFVGRIGNVAEFLYLDCAGPADSAPANSAPMHPAQRDTAPVRTARAA